MDNSVAEHFASWLAGKRKALGITLEELQKRTGIKKQHLSVLERAAPHPMTGKPTVPRRPTVEKIAAGLNASKEEAFQAAGYWDVDTKTTIPIGNRALVMLQDQNLTEEEQKEIAKELSFAYEVIMARRQRSS